MSKRAGLSGATYLLLSCLVLAPALASDPAARDVKVVCDRWPDGSTLRRFALDAIRLNNAKTEQDRALAVLQWMRRWTMFTDGHAPKERGRNVLDDLKILHVYGAHWCDGRALLMENLWRSIGGRAYKLYVPVGYTMALVRWRDPDGVRRWHQIHASRGWYLYDRSGKRIVGPDDVATDSSLLFRPSRTGIPYSGYPPRPWNWIAVGHRRFSTHDLTLDLHRGGRYSRQWGNEGVPACDNVAEEQNPDGQHGPYKVTYGNGRLVRSLHLGAAEGTDGTCTLDVPLRLPHVMADAWLEGPLPAGLKTTFTPEPKAAFRMPAPRGGRVELGRKCGGPKSVVGRYRFPLRLEWPAAQTPKEPVRLVVVVQHNLFSLPQLQPGRNRVTVSGALTKGTALRVTYEWTGKGGAKKNVTVVETTPRTYEVLADGRVWADVVCRRLTIECIAADGKGNRTLVKEPACEVRPPPPVPHFDGIVGGDRRPPKLRSTAAYVGDLADPAKRDDALYGLMVRRDPKAAPALITLLYSDEKMPLPQMGRIAQAIYLSLPNQEAFDALLPVVRQDERVRWIHTNEKIGWKSLSSLIAHLAAEADYQAAGPDLIAAFKKGVGRWNYPTYLRAFGRLKAREAVPLCIGKLRHHSDVSCVAAWALGELGDRSAIPHLIKHTEWRLEKKPHQAILAAETARALGKLGARSAEAIALLEKMLVYRDEEVRGMAAEALGRVGSKKHAAMLAEAARTERFGWVRERMEAAARRLGDR
jgi:HEAT repeat protein